jgi:hypothetical protein
VPALARVAGDRDAEEAAGELGGDLLGAQRPVGLGHDLQDRHAQHVGGVGLVHGASRTPRALTVQCSSAMELV